MRKLIAMTAITLLSFGVVTAQTRLISGKVTDPSGAPVPGATVTTKSGVAVAADEKGNFQINAQQGEVLTITSIDHATTTTKVGESTSLTVTMAAAENKLSEVVVTALGIRRNKNTLPMQHSR
jgi:hypothetical protein